MTLLIALVAELLAVGGPAWCGARLPSHEPADRSRTVEAAKVADSAPDAALSVSAPQVEPVAALPGFLAGLVKSDRPTAFKVLYEMYEGACRAAGAEPESKRAVGLAMSRRFDKVKGGDVAYYARPRLAVVAA